MSDMASLANIKSQIETLLAKKLRLNDLHTALIEINVPVGFLKLERLIKQKKDISAEQILAISTLKQSEGSTLRKPAPDNAKYAHRRDPLSVESPSIKRRNWRKDHDDPSIVFSSPESKGDISLCNMMSEDARREYEATGNILYVLQAFYQRVDFLSGSLSEEYVQGIESQDSDREYHDGGGLYLLVTPDGTKEWHFEYPLAGEGRDYRFGNYPADSLSYARRYTLAARDLLCKGKDPSCIQYEHELLVRVDCVHESEPDVPIPAWMAQALSDGFKHYYSRRFLSRENISLDTAFGIEGSKRQEEFDLFTIDTSKLLEKTRELQWYFQLAFSTACKHALELLKLF